MIRNSLIVKCCWSSKKKTLSIWWCSRRLDANVSAFVSSRRESWCRNLDSENNCSGWRPTLCRVECWVFDKKRALIEYNLCYQWYSWIIKTIWAQPIKNIKKNETNKTKQQLIITGGLKLLKKKQPQKIKKIEKIFKKNNHKDQKKPLHTKQVNW